MPVSKNTAESAAVKKSNELMENQLDVPKFGCKKEQPEVNVQVVFESKPQSREDREDKFIMYSFVAIMTILNFVLLIKQVW